MEYVRRLLIGLKPHPPSRRQPAPCHGVHPSAGGRRHRTGLQHPASRRRITEQGSTIAGVKVDGATPREFRWEELPDSTPRASLIGTWCIGPDPLVIDLPGQDNDRDIPRPGARPKTMFSVRTTFTPMVIVHLPGGRSAGPTSQQPVPAPSPGITQFRNSFNRIVVKT